MDITQVAGLLALPISIAAVIFAARQAKSNERSASAAQRQASAAEIDSRFPALVDILREFRTKEHTKARHYIIQELRSEYPADGSGFRAIKNQTVLLEVLEVMHFLDNLGLFVRVGFINSWHVSMFMGRSIENISVSLQPYIQDEREKRSPDYGENFSHLVKLCNAKSQAEARRTI